MTYCKKGQSSQELFKTDLCTVLASQWDYCRWFQKMQLHLAKHHVNFFLIIQEHLKAYCRYRGAVKLFGFLLSPYTQGGFINIVIILEGCGIIKSLVLSISYHWKPLHRICRFPPKTWWSCKLLWCKNKQHYSHNLLNEDYCLLWYNKV